MSNTAEPTDEEAALLDAALGRIAEKGYVSLALSELATIANVPLATVYRAFPNKTAILEALIRRVDLALLSEAVDPGASARDRLFDLLMRRFEALAPYRAAVRVVYRDMKRRPAEALALAPTMIRAMDWIIDIAGLSGGGAIRPLRAPALGALYASVVPVWLDDDDPGLARTMAALDRRLRRVEEVVERLQPKPRQSDGGNA